MLKRFWFVPILLGLALFPGFMAKAQSVVNLVPNPQLSTFSSCPTALSQTSLCVGWFAPGDGTSDYFNTCSPLGPPYNYALTSNMPHSLPGMLGFCTYTGYGGVASPVPDYREYVACQLTSPMIPGNTYTVSFWRASRNGGGSGYYANNLGILFSDTICHQPANAPLTFSYSPINMLPQWEETSIITDTVWVQKTFTISPPPGSNWQYLTVGNFRNNQLTSVSPSPLLATSTTSLGAAYYFVDDFEVNITASSLTLTAVSTSVTCHGGSNGSATVTASGGTAPYHYQWSNGDTTATASNLSAGTYTVIAWDNTSTTPSTPLVVSIGEPNPLSATIAVAPLPACTGNTVTVSAGISGGTPAYTFLWSTGAANTPSISAVVPAQVTTYSLTVGDAQGCSQTFTLNLPPAQPNAGFLMTPQCNNTVLFSNTSIAAINYAWNYGDGSSSAQQQAPHHYASAGMYTVSLVAIDAQGCQDSLSQPVAVSTGAIASFSYAAIACSDSVVFTNTSSGASSFAWNFGDGQTSSLQNPVHVFSGLGSPTVTLITDPGQACSDTVAIPLSNLWAPPLAGFSYSIGPDNELNFQNLSSHASQAYWSFGDGSPGSTTWDAQHVFDASDTTSFLICLDVWNSQGCSDSICKTIMLLPDMTLYVPNTFTPNGDQINDRFQASGLGIARFNMSIFNRWGQQIFYTEDIQQGWDGTYKNQNAPVDVYIWTIEVTSKLHKTFTRTGHVNLVK